MTRYWRGYRNTMPRRGPSRSWNTSSVCGLPPTQSRRSMHAAVPAAQLTNLTVDGAGRTCHRPCGRKLEFTDASEDLLAGKRRLDAVEDGGRRRPATSHPVLLVELLASRGTPAVTSLCISAQYVHAHAREA